jgi:hypothetical protein
MYVLSIRQLPPAERLCLQAIFSISGKNQRQETDRPSVYRRMVDRHAAFFHNLLEVRGAQRIGGIPADADQDHVNRSAHTCEVEHVDSSWFWEPQFTDRPADVR